MFQRKREGCVKHFHWAMMALPGEWSCLFMPVGEPGEIVWAVSTILSECPIDWEGRLGPPLVLKKLHWFEVSHQRSAKAYSEATRFWCSASEATCFWGIGWMYSWVVLHAHSWMLLLGCRVLFSIIHSQIQYVRQCSGYWKHSSRKTVSAFIGIALS